MKIAVGFLLATASVLPGIAAADDFPRNREISIFVGFSAGGGYDQYARLIARHLGAALGGASVVVKNMPGAGSIVAAHHLYTTAPRDGTSMGLIASNLHINQVLGDPQVRFDLLKMTWIGRIADSNSVLIVRREAQVKSASDLLKYELVTGVPGAGSAASGYLSLMNELLGTKFKLVSGYRGSSDIFLALERGEVDASNSALWPEMKTQHPELLRKTNIIMQTGLDAAEDLPGTPRAVDLAETDEQRQIMRIFFSYNTIGRALVAPPEVPELRAKILRAAFHKAVSSSEMNDEAKQRGLQVNPLPAEGVRQVIEEVFSYAPSVIRKAKALSFPQ